MEKIKISELPTFDKLRNEDRLFSHVPSFGELGYIPSSLITSGGVAMRRWNVNNASPIGEAVGDIGFLRELPSLLGLGCYLVDRNHGRRKLDPNNHYKLATGEAAKLDGTMGDYMWGWGTKWYYAFWTEGEYYYEGASLKPIRGRQNYVVPVGSTAATGQTTVDRETEELVSVVSDLPRYRGGNNDASKDGAFNTQLGRGASNQSQDVYGSYARKKGLGWEAYWYSFPAAIGALTRIIFGTRHLQTAFNANKDSNGLFQGGLGEGVTNVNSTQWSEKFGHYSFVPTSVGIELGDSCGEASYDVPDSDGSIWTTVKIPVFFGLKNFYGLTNRWERGKLFSMNADTSGDCYVVPQLHSDYNINSISGLRKVAVLAPGIDYISQLSMQNLCHVPTVLGASPSTYYADRSYSNGTSGLRASAVGGSANSGSHAGPECLTALYAPSTAYAYYGSPLCESQENWDTTPVIVG